jgi:hypothetical protein
MPIKIHKIGIRSSPEKKTEEQIINITLPIIYFGALLS